MKTFRFTYRPTIDANFKSDITIEAEEKENAITTFEDNYPSLEWRQITEEN